MSRDTAPDLRLTALALGAWAMALVGVFLPTTVWWCGVGAAMGAAVLLCIAGARARRGGGARTALGLPAVILLCGAAVAVTCGLAAPERAVAAGLDGRVVEVTAVISSSVSVGADGRMWFDAQTIRAGPRDAPLGLAVPVRIGAEAREEGGLDLGAQIRVWGDARATDAGERAVFIVFANETTIEQPATGVFAVAAGVRTDFVARAIRLPEPGAGLLPGLAVGDTTAVPQELNAAMLASGLSHLTAVSGANCAIVVAAVFWFVALCGGGRTLRAVLSLLALAAFVVLVTPEPSVIRAATMAGLAMLTLLCGRPTAGISVLCLAVVVILIADPWLAATPGFALSAAATAALILLAPPITRGLERAMPQPLALGIAVPLAAQLVCGPIIALFSEQQSLIAVAANLLAAPAAPIATVIGLLACLAAPVPPLADILAASAWLPSAWIATTATTSAALPAAQIAVTPGLLSALLVAVLSAALTVPLWHARDGTPAPWFLRLVATGTLLVVVALGGARLLLNGPLATATVPEEWSIAACDVGQGDALLVRSEDRVALIDTGAEDEPLQRCLSALGIDRIDLLVLTHFDLDHVGAAPSIVGRVETLLHGPVSDPQEDWLLAAFDEAGTRIIEASSGTRGTLGAAEWRVLWPRKESAAFPPGNDASVVLEISGGGVPSALFLGDLGAVAQRALISGGGVTGTYDVVKVAHHGSADQDSGLYERIRPVVALFSVGAGNEYGHPRAETLALAESVGAVELRTDQEGRLLLALRDGELAVWTERTASSGSDVGGSG